MVFAKGSVEKQTKEEDEFDEIISWHILERIKNNVLYTLTPVELNNAKSPQDALIVAPFLPATPLYSPKDPREMVMDLTVCDMCGRPHVAEFYADGNYVCQSCGYVRNNTPVFFEQKTLNNGVVSTVLMQSSYKRIHYWNERMHQWLCFEPWLLDRTDLDRLRLALASMTTSSSSSSSLSSPTQPQSSPSCSQSTALTLTTTCSSCTPSTSGTSMYVSKTKIRNALRMIGHPELVEKWVTILCQLSKTRPPSPDGDVVLTMRELFMYIEIAFMIHKPKDRKSMIHYNFVFVRILQFLNQPQFYRYFPLLKSRAKVRSIDAVWHKMADYLGWKYLPLPNAKAFKM